MLLVRPRCAEKGEKSELFSITSSLRDRKTLTGVDRVAGRFFGASPSGAAVAPSSQVKVVDVKGSARWCVGGWVPSLRDGVTELDISGVGAPRGFWRAHFGARPRRRVLDFDALFCFFTTMRGAHNGVAPVELRARFWVFTQNNIPQVREEIELLDFARFPPSVRFCTYSLERGVNGHYHFQGYVELSRTQRLAFMRRIPILPGAHWEVRRGTQAQAIAYAEKGECVLGLRGSLLGEFRGGDSSRRLSLTLRIDLG